MNFNPPRPASPAQPRARESSSVSGTLITQLTNPSPRVFLEHIRNGGTIGISRTRIRLHWNLHTRLLNRCCLLDVPPIPKTPRPHPLHSPPDLHRGIIAPVRPHLAHGCRAVRRSSKQPDGFQGLRRLRGSRPRGADTGKPFLEEGLQARNRESDKSAADFGVFDGEHRVVVPGLVGLPLAAHDKVEANAGDAREVRILGSVGGW